MTNSINEIRDASCILAIGTNTTEDHPDRPGDNERGE